MKKPLFLLTLFMVFLLIPETASAIQTAYVSFEEPENWACELAQGVWICQSGVQSDRKESVILSIATQATEWDSLENYEKYLKRPRKIQGPDGQVMMSKVTYTRRKNINGHMWVDSLQHNSELPGFWSRYLATIHKTKDTKLAILITYIVSEGKYKKLSPQFMRMVASLKPKTNFNLASKQGNEFLDEASNLGSVQANILKNRLNPVGSKEVVEEEDNSLASLMVLGLLAGTLLFVMRRRRKRKEKAKRTSKMRRPARRAPTQLRTG